MVTANIAATQTQTQHDIMSTTLAITTTTEATTAIATDNKHIAAFTKAVEAYARQTGTFKEKTVKTVEALRIEGYDDKVIAAALRNVVEKFGISRQHLNRVLTAPTAEGGAGMAATRKHEASASKGLKSKVDTDTAKGGVTVKLGEAESLFAALMVEFDGRAAKVMVLAEKLNALAQQHLDKAAKAAE